MSQNQRSRAYCFTINNYTKEEYEHLKLLDSVYLIVGKEKGELGTNHLQGYIYFRNAKSFNRAKELIGERAHVEVARGNPEQNRTYCSKGGDFLELGELPVKGKRSDLDKAVQLITEGATMRKLAKEMPKQVVLHSKGLQHLINVMYEDKQGDRETPRETYWLWGDTGAGKTKFIKDKEKELFNTLGWRTYYWPVSKGFFTNYDHQEIAVFDDFDADTMDFRTLLKITDPWCNPAINTKGDSTIFVANLVYFTSTLDSTGTLRSKVPTDKDMDQIRRRIKDIHMPYDLDPNPPDETEPTQPDDPFINQL